MLNYKECSIEAFESAMQQKNADVSTISTEHLFILYTKFKADALTCFFAGTSYAHGVGAKSENKSEAFRLELLRRGVQL